MDAIATLAIFAQIAVSLTGFAGLLTAFRGGGHEWSPAEIAGVRNLLLTSVGALSFSAMPIPALAAGLAERFVWAFASMALAFFIFLLFVAGLDYVWRQKGKPRSPFFFWLFTVGAPPLAILLAMSAAGFILPSGVAMYAAGLIWLLAIGTVQFMFQIFATLTPSDKP